MATATVWVIGALLAVAALLTLVRIVRGPSVLDRVVATDVLVSTLVCVLGTEAAVHRHTTTLPLLVSLSLIGFVGAVAVARFVVADPDGTETTRAEATTPQDDA